MYDEIYAALVDSGNATTSNEPSFAYSGSFVTHYHLTHPQNCLVVDEVGSDTIQRDMLEEQKLMWQRRDSIPTKCNDG